jgi:hypothetical protein
MCLVSTCRLQVCFSLIIRKKSKLHTRGVYPISVNCDWH